MTALTESPFAPPAPGLPAGPPLDVLLPTLGSAGDIYPVLALGRALVVRGHRAVVVANDHYQDLAAAMGLDFIALGTEGAFRHLLDHPDMWHPRRSFPLLVREGITPLLRPLFDIIAAADPARTVVAASCLTVGARVAQEALGVPMATLLLQPSMLRSAHRSPVLAGVRPPDWIPPAWKRRYYGLIDRLVIDPVLVPAVEPLRRELGLPPQRRHFDRWLFSTTRTIGLFPDWFAEPQPDWPPQVRLAGFIRFDPADVAPTAAQTAELREMEDFLAAGEAPLVFTPGSAMKQGRDFFAAAAEAAGRLGRRAVLLTRFPEQLPDRLPRGVRHFGYLPLARLLPRAAALVHHGGIGTMAQALAAGIPQMVMPLAFDQFDNAWRLERLGVAASLSAARFRGPTLARKLAVLLDDAALAGRCRNLAARMDNAASLEAACRWIEGLAAVGMPERRAEPMV
jgi:rhamnosyltransferase subunit B